MASEPRITRTGVQLATLTWPCNIYSHRNLSSDMSLSLSLSLYHRLILALIDSRKRGGLVRITNSTQLKFLFETFAVLWMFILSFRWFPGVWILCANVFWVLSVTSSQVVPTFRNSLYRLYGPVFLNVGTWNSAVGESPKRRRHWY
jgi:hypothetical protein